jgi:integral membrane protein
MNLRNMRYVALAEATTFLILLAFTVLKHTGGSDVGVSIMGPIHGALFIAYVVIALNLRPQLGWSGRTTFWVLVGAVIPFGGYVVDWWLLRDEAGATDPPSA